MVGLDLEGLSQNDSDKTSTTRFRLPVLDSLQVGFWGFI